MACIVLKGVSGMSNSYYTHHIIVECLQLQDLYLLLSPEFAHELALKGNISLSLVCANSEIYCFDIHYKGETDEAQHDCSLTYTKLNYFQLH